MPRLLGVDIPGRKRIEYSIQYIHGIGPASAASVLNEAKVDPATKADIIVTHPVSIGRQEWTTPHGVTSIIAKHKNPNWYPPESIREEHAEMGDPLPKIVPAGPDNPLGDHAIRLGLPGYLIHGTNKPYGIGMRVTHGCIRMYPKDVAAVYDLVRVGTKVVIVNQPYKVGIENQTLYLEVHPHLREDQQKFQDQITQTSAISTCEKGFNFFYDILRKETGNTKLASKIPFAEVRILSFNIFQSVYK